MPEHDSAPQLAWDFPLPRTHTGVLLGNGTQGLMVWGVDSLNITVGRAGFWDHRGGNLFASRTTYAEVRALLEANDEPALRKVFARPDARPGYPAFPTQIGGGRLELHFAEQFRPVRGVLDTGRAALAVTLAAPDGRTADITIRQAVDQELAWVELDQVAHSLVTIKLIPTWEYVGEYLASVGCAPPERWDRGFCQYLPEDEPLALAWALQPTSNQESTLAIATALGADAALRARTLAESGDWRAAGTQADSWWGAYWRDVPYVRVPDAIAQHAWDYGIYKLAGLTMPGAVPASLQGPWIEEYQLPPWSCDYHFNINIQMIYWPCLVAGRFEHFWPLWEMILGWMPRLRENGAHFFGADDALLMPHAVDDRCAAVGAFWTGMIDQACAAWMGQLAWLHYRYSGDQRVLREVAWPLMVGAFGGYWAMLEELPATPTAPKRLSLPVSVSPEYNADQMNAWGRDASFQLAALHFLVDALPAAAQALGEPEDPRWARVRAEVPPYTLAGPETHPRLALWENQDLERSHRHHAHMGGIYPFCTIDTSDPAHTTIIQNTFQHWIVTGAGEWSGWCVPWASILYARCGMSDAAVQWLHWWKEVFTNEGHGTLHNAAFPGCTTIWGWPRDKSGELRELMQADAGMGAVNAVQELLVQQHGTQLRVMPYLPRDWKNLEFDGLWVEGGFRVGATIAGGRVTEVRVESTRGGPLRLAHGIKEVWELAGQSRKEQEIELDTQPGQRLVLRRQG